MNALLNGLTIRDLEILDIIYKNGPQTKNDLIEKLNLKLTTLNRSMKVLVNRKLIVESGISESTGGRKPVNYDVAQEGIYTIGIDISRTYVQFLVMNLKQFVLEDYRFDIDSGITPQNCIDKIADEIIRTLSHMAIRSESVIGIGVGTVGPLNREKGSLLYPQGFPNSSWNDDIPIKDMLQNATGIPCTIDNGANTALLAEYLFGSGRGYRCVAYLHCGVGIRSAIIRDGHIIRTMNDRDDAFAHMTVDIHGEQCQCGGRGCLENYVSLRAIRQNYFSDSGKYLEFKDLFNHAVRNDQTASRAFTESARILGLGISNLSRLTDPELIILSGPLVSNCEAYYSECIKSFHEQNGQHVGPVFVKEGLFKKDIIAIGAGLVVLDQYINQKGGLY